MYMVIRLFLYTSCKTVSISTFLWYSLSSVQGVNLRKGMWHAQSCNISGTSCKSIMPGGYLRVVTKRGEFKESVLDHLVLSSVPSEKLVR